MGDEIMAAGEVKRLCAGRPLRFAVWDRRRDLHRWHEAWEGNPRIARPGEPFDEKLYNHGGNRPYAALKTSTRWVWRSYRPEPGELFLTDFERSFARYTRDAVVVHAALKAGASPNKQWPKAYWNALVPSLGLRVVQVGSSTDERIPGAEFLHTPTLRCAFGALAGARAAVLQEGGLHHAAAALGVRAVVLFGGFISPKCTGYDLHVNLFNPTGMYPLGCGARQRCAHCIEAMRLFKPADVKTRLEGII